jgi:hypothetical protein
VSPFDKRSGLSPVLLLGIPVLCVLGASFELHRRRGRSDIARPEGPSPSSLPTPALSAAEIAVRQHAAVPGLIAIGCTDPAVADDEAVARLGRARPSPNIGTIPVVYCKVPPGRRSPSCGDVARVYLEKAALPQPYFRAVVLEIGSGAVVCQNRFTADREDMGE